MSASVLELVGGGFGYLWEGDWARVPTRVQHQVRDLIHHELCAKNLPSGEVRIVVTAVPDGKHFRADATLRRYMGSVVRTDFRVAPEIEHETTWDGFPLAGLEKDEWDSITRNAFNRSLPYRDPH